MSTMYPWLFSMLLQLVSCHSVPPMPSPRVYARPTRSSGVAVGCVHAMLLTCRVASVLGLLHVIAARASSAWYAPHGFSHRFFLVVAHQSSARHVPVPILSIVLIVAGSCLLRLACGLGHMSFDGHVRRS